MYLRALRVSHSFQLPLPPISFRTISSYANTSSSPADPTNQRFSVDPDGNKVVDLTFASESLGMPAAQGYGWAQLDFGEHIGPGNRYNVARKLGWGMHSSTWLARDEQDNKFIAIKALTGYHTEMYERGVVWEADALRLLSRPPSSPHCTPLLNEFILPGKGSSGSHMCFVLPIYGGDVKALHKSFMAPFPLPLAKRIILHMLRGLAHAHERGVAHTDLKHDNIFFTTTLATEDMEAWMAKDPSRRHPPEASHDGLMQAAVSQPLPMISEDEALRATYVLADYGTAQPSGLHENRTITSLPLRAPECFLGAEWDKPADIWSFGCLIYELVTSKPLFLYQINEKFGLTETENMLYQMILYTEEDFRAAQLSVSPSAPEFFRADCQLKKNPTIFEWPIVVQINDKNVVSPEEASRISSLIERCLHLNPEERASAKDLLSDPWFEGEV